MKRIVLPKVLVVLVFLGTSALIGAEKQPVAERPINVVFRLDDYSALSSTETELKIIEAFREVGAAVTFAVIPSVNGACYANGSIDDYFPLPAEKGDILRTAMRDGVVDVALHGYSHKRITPTEKAEFAGLPYDVQLGNLTKGKKYLDDMLDTSLTLFVPPWNRYDGNTLRALEALGFKTLSADKRGWAPRHCGLKFLAASCGLPQVREAVAAARASSDRQPLVVVLFHEFDFQEVGPERAKLTVPEFRDLLGWLKSQSDVRLLSVSQAAEVIDDLTADRSRRVSRYGVMERLLPRPLQDAHSAILYPEAPALAATVAKLGGIYAAVAVAGAIAAFGLGRMMWPKSTCVVKAAAVGSAVLALAMLVYAFHDHKAGFKGVVLSVAVIGTTLGLLACWRWLNDRMLRPAPQLGPETVPDGIEETHP